MQRSKVSIRMWLIIVLIGFAGQLAWMIENMYLNTYIKYLNDTAIEHFDYQNMITLTVSISAGVATLTTVLMGAVIDKIRHKKLFISIGYILWGLSTASFGLFNVGSSASILKVTSTALFAAIMVVVIDGVMTYFGSTANDAAFNSFITSETNDINRGKVEGVLAIMPLIAVLFITVVLNPFTTVDNNYRWDLFFYIVGGVVILVGVLSFILIPKEFNIPNNSNQNVFKNILYGFRPKIIKDNKLFYLVLICYFVFALSNQTFFPQLMIYIEETCKIENSGANLITPFALVFAISILLGSIFTVLMGFIGDKKGKHVLLIPNLIIYSIGLLLMSLIPLIKINIIKLIYGILSASIMMVGFISGPALLNAYIREFIPKGKEGSFLGIRMVFVVFLPMVIGSNLAETISKTHNMTKLIGSEEIIIPSPLIFVGALVIAALLFFPMKFLVKKIKDYNIDDIEEAKKIKNYGYLYKVTDDIKIDYSSTPLSQYPRPQLRRDSYMSLNGCWNFDIKKERLFPAKLERKIMVPYSVESKLSGIEQLVEIDDYLFYEKEVVIPNDFNKGRLILHFDGVDQICEVYVNQQFVYKHVGGFTPFSVELPNDIGNKFTISLIVKDITDFSYYTTGKQRLKRNGWFYSSVSGVYFPIWLESVCKNYITNVKFIPYYDDKKVGVIVSANVNDTGSITIKDKKFKFTTNSETLIDLKDDFNPWSIESPYLYDCEIKLKDDKVESYFALRKIEIKEEDGFKLLFLNDKKIFLNGLLDQGYYYLGNYTPRDYSDYRLDILKAKSLGFNTLRKHVKIEHELYYYYADKYGILLIQDFPNGGTKHVGLNVFLPRIFSFCNNYNLIKNPYKYFSREDTNSREIFLNEIETWVNNLYNHPSIIVYTIFNEGWGQFDSKQIYHKLKEEDNTRLYDSTSGWYYDKDNSDFFSVHTYTFPNLPRKNKYKQAYLLSEMGGLGYKVKNHSYFGDKYFAHKKSATSKQFATKYAKLYGKTVFTQKISKGLVGSIYTQLNDCETELNGIYTFDRKVLKIDSSLILEINKRIEH